MNDSELVNELAGKLSFANQRLRQEREIHRLETEKMRQELESLKTVVGERCKVDSLFDMSNHYRYEFKATMSVAPGAVEQKPSDLRAMVRHVSEALAESIAWAIVKAKPWELRRVPVMGEVLIGPGVEPLRSRE